MPVQRVNTQITQENKDNILQAISLLDSYLSFCINLSPEELRRTRGLGDKVFSDTQHTLKILLEHPAIKPGHVDLFIYSNNIDIAKFLSGDVILKLDKIREKVIETAKAAATDANIDARHIYHNTKKAVEGLVPGSKAALEQLSKLYARKKSTSTDDETPSSEEPQEEPPTTNQ